MGLMGDSISPGGSGALTHYRPKRGFEDRPVWLMSRAAVKAVLQFEAVQCKVDGRSRCKFLNLQRW